MSGDGFTAVPIGMAASAATLALSPEAALELQIMGAAALVAIPAVWVGLYVERRLRRSVASGPESLAKCVLGVMLAAFLTPYLMRTQGMAVWPSTIGLLSLSIALIAWVSVLLVVKLWLKAVDQRVRKFLDLPPAEQDVTDPPR